MAGADLRSLLRLGRRAPRPEHVEVEDIQAFVLQGYGKLRGAAYLLFQISDGGAARSWLLAVLEDITLGARRPSGRAANVAFTASGLTRLGMAPRVLTGFAPEFVEGMTSAHRSRLLGDFGEAAPDTWAWGGPDRDRVDVLLMIFATTGAELDEQLGRHRSHAADHGLREIAALETQDIGFAEHFGFRDGLSQPSIAGVGPPSADLHTVRPGEFLLGYRNEHGQTPRSPTVDSSDNRSQHLPPAPGDASRRDLGRNGSYLVLRTLNQDVAAFWRYADAQTRRPDGTSDPEKRTALAARMVGRWPSGAPLTLSPTHDQESLAHENDFRYHAEDRQGFSCPVGAHVRRTNPRDSEPPKPGTETSVAVGKGHRLIRRGRSFGSRVDPEAAVSGDDQAGEVRGLHFIALCADIARQFEFISHTWVQNPHFGGLFDDADPLLGGHAGAGGGFTVQQRPLRRRYPDTPVSVTVRGGAYFFLPGARALRYLASG